MKPHDSAWSFPAHFAAGRIGSFLSVAGLAACLALAGSEAFAQATAVTLSGSYGQNFDSMPNSSSAALPKGWSFFRSGTSAVQPDYLLSGSNTTVVGAAAGSVGTAPITGAAYQWVTGSAASGTDKAIGFLSTGSYPGAISTAPGQSLAILFGFMNTTSGPITTLDLTWDYEKYRSGTRAMDWKFYSSTDGSTWTATSAGDQNYAADANTTTLFNPPTVSSKTVSLSGLSIPTGSNFYFRWSYVATGSWSNAQGLGFDNFTMSPTVSGSNDLYWDGGSWTTTAPGIGGSGTWTDGSGSWDQTKRANFGGTAGTVTVGAATTANGLAFTTGGSTLTDGTVSLAGASSGVNTITTDIGTTTITTVLAGTAGLMKLGGGALVLGGSNTFSGGLTISGGTIQIGSDANLGDAANALSIDGTLKTTADVSLGSGRGVTGGPSLDIAPGTTLTVNGAYGTTSTTLVNSGTLSLQGSTRSVGTLTFDTAATVVGSGGLTVAGITATGVTSGTATIVPAITFTAASGDKTVDVGSGGTLALPGDIAGTTNRIAKTGAGTLVVSGSNTTAGFRLGITGSTPTDGGTLVINAAAASGTGAIQLNSGTLKTDVPGGLTLANGLTIGGRSDAVAVIGGTEPLTFTGSSSFLRGVGTTGELRLDVDNVTTLSGVLGLTSGGGVATGVTIGGNGQLILNGNGLAMLDEILVTDTLLLELNGSIGGDLVMAGSTILDGGGGLVAGNLSFTVGSKLLLDIADPMLTVNGPSVSFVNFTIANIAGLDSSTPLGTYDLIGGMTITGTNGLANIGPLQAFDLGDGISAYFLPNNGPAALTLVVVPEPTSFDLTGIGFAALAVSGWRRRNRTAARREHICFRPRSGRDGIDVPSAGPVDASPAGLRMRAP